MREDGWIDSQIPKSQDPDGNNGDQDSNTANASHVVISLTDGAVSQPTFQVVSLSQRRTRSL